MTTELNPDQRAALDGGLTLRERIERATAHIIERACELNGLPARVLTFDPARSCFVNSQAVAEWSDGTPVVFDARVPSNFILGVDRGAPDGSQTAVAVISRDGRHVTAVVTIKVDDEGVMRAVRQLPAKPADEGD